MIWFSLAALAADAEHRSISGHRFPIPAQVDSPFSASQFALRQGIGILSIPNVQFEDFPTPVDLSLLGFTESVDASARIFGENAVFAEISGNLSAGSNANTAFFRGAEGGISAELGARHTWWCADDRFVFSLRTAARYRRGYDLEPSNVVIAALERREETLSAILRGDYLRYILASERSTSMGVGVSAAYALNRHFGLQAGAIVRLGGRYRQSYDATLDERVIEQGPFAALGTGLALDYDLQPKIPLDVLVEYRTREDGGLFGDGDNELVSRHFMALGAFYSGQPALQLGAMWTILLVGGESERYQTAEIGFRYFF